ncbi:MAG: hypothetical protein K2N20_00925, partial [Helicobacter sp.]|nr:hypothetical protein [Helicobacter sp.]
VNSPQRCVYVMPCGSNIDVARCGWEIRIKSNSRLRNCGIQSGAVLWLCHSFARAFYWGFCLIPPPCASRGMGWVVMLRRSRNISSLESHKILAICHCERR